MGRLKLVQRQSGRIFVDLGDRLAPMILAAAAAFVLWLRRRRARAAAP